VGMVCLNSAGFEVSALLDKFMFADESRLDLLIDMT